MPGETRLLNAEFKMRVSLVNIENREDFKRLEKDCSTL